MLKKWASVLCVVFFTLCFFPYLCHTLELHPEGKFSYYRAKTEFDKKNYTKALFHIQEYLEVDDKNPTVYLLLAQTYEQLDNKDGAKQNYLKSINLSQDETKHLAQLSYGIFLYREKSFEEARNFLSEAAEGFTAYSTDFKEKKALAHYYLAWIYFEKNKWHDALQQFKKADQWTQELKQGTQFYSGICAYKLGTLEEAKNYFESASKIDPYSKLGSFADKFIDRIEATQKQGGKPSFSFLLGTHSFYDSNVVNENNGPFANFPNLSDRDDFALGFIGTSTIEKTFKSFDVEAQFRGIYNRHFSSTFRNTDIGDLSAALDFSKHFGSELQSTLTLSPNFKYVLSPTGPRNTWKKLYSGLGGDLNYYFTWNQYVKFGVGGYYSFNNYRVISSTVRNRDGHYYGALASNYLSLLKDRLYIDTTASFDMAHTKGSDSEATGFGIETLGGYYLWKELKMELGFSYSSSQNESYNGVSTGNTTLVGLDTDSFIYSASLSNQWTVWENPLLVYVDYSYNDTKSNQFTNAYHKHIALVGLSYQF